MGHVSTGLAIGQRAAKYPLPGQLPTTVLAAQSDPSVPLVSIFSSAIWHPANSQQHRPRPSLQVYYTAPDAADPARMASAAPCSRGKKFSLSATRAEILPNATGWMYSGGRGVVDACVEHQRREIASRNGGRDWYIQRYDVGGGDWRTALVTVRSIKLFTQ
ncbi:hypothetical protein Hte_006408 [Hypoxylon texense]